MQSRMTPQPTVGQHVHLYANGRDEHVESDGAVRISLHECHEEAKANEDHQVYLHADSEDKWARTCCSMSKW
jgi:hypothetical protein